MCRKISFDKWIVLRENVEVAVRSVSQNKLRSALTIAIIAVGICSLVAVETAVGALTEAVRSVFSRMGASAFTVTAVKARGGDAPGRIAFAEAEEFLTRFDAGSGCAFSTLASGEKVS